jgi:hypothetical protein
VRAGLLHRDRVIGAAFDGGVVGDDEDLAAGHAANPRHQPRPWCAVFVHVPRGERREFKEGRARIKQPIDALAHRQLPLFAMALEVFGTAALAAHRDPVAELFHEAGEMLAVGVKFRGVGSNLTVNAVHGRSNRRARTVGAL